nr:hypothetical protein [Rhodococcus sp. (in: high G+C Gram-positive bacteria)]
MTNDDDIHGSVVAAAIDVVDDTGCESASLATIAERSGHSESAVVEIFPDFAALISATVAWMFGDVAHYVGSRIDEQPDGLPKIQTYIRAMNRYYFDNPKYLRVVAEVLGGGIDGAPGDRTRERRWQAVADLLSDGQRRGLLGTFDTRAVAIVIGGGIDGLITEWTMDPEFDLLGGTEELVAMVESLTKGAVFDA